MKTLIIVMGLFIAGLSAFAQQVTETDPALQMITNQLRMQLTASLSGRIKPELDNQRLLEFYQAREFYPAWIDHDGPLQRAEALSQALQTADQDGLDVAAYHPGLIATLWQTRTTTQLARLELLLTDAFFRYSVHLGAGRFHENNFHWEIEPPEIDPVAELDSLLTANSFQTALHDLTPAHAGYLRLREMLKTYQQLEQQGGWPGLPAGDYLTLGLWRPRVVTLRQRLMAEGDLQIGPAKHARFYNEAVQLAVERFQLRHGLKVDGVIGPKTLAALNVTVSERIKQIQYNMERWRWLPKRLGLRYIMVNTAGFNLAVVENEVIQFNMGVITGKPDRPTPVTSSQLHTVVFNPFWTIPPTIIIKDLLPRQQSDPTFFSSRQIRVFSNGEEQDPAEIDWTQVSLNPFPYILRQDPGPRNFLGRLKFLFSNPYNVYLHDTPGDQLFKRDSRAFSSGCIRVEKPVQLASYLLDRKNGWENDWTVDRIESQLASNENLEVPVPVTIPIYLVYMTAWVDEAMGIQFRPDIYDRDPKWQKCGELPLNE